MTGRTTTIAVNVIATLALTVAVVVTLLLGTGRSDVSSTATSPEVGETERTSTSSGSAIRRFASSGATPAESARGSGTSSAPTPVGADDLVKAAPEPDANVASKFVPSPEPRAFTNEMQPEIGRSAPPAPRPAPKRGPVDPPVRPSESAEPAREAVVPEDGPVSEQVAVEVVQQAEVSPTEVSEPTVTPPPITPDPDSGDDLDDERGPSSGDDGPPGRANGQTNDSDDHNEPRDSANGRNDDRGEDDAEPRGNANGRNNDRGDGDEERRHGNSNGRNSQRDDD